MAFASSSSSASSASAPSLQRATTFVLGVTPDIRTHYTLGEQLGQPGQFGYALKAVNKTTKEVRAVKVISKCKFSRAADKKIHFEELRTEIDILRRLDHPNIIKLFNVYENETEIYLVTELCSGGELFDRIKSRGQYNEKDAAATLRQIVSGLGYLHKNKIAHCDLKPDNFLFLSAAEDSLCKIIDFGMSKYVRRRQYFHSLRGTPYYIAPEVIQGHYSYHCDMWSLGVVMFVMLFGYPPFHAENDNDIFRLILKGFDPVVKKGYRAHFPQDIPCSDSAKDLLSKLLTSDTARRLTAEEALDHPWLKGDTASNTPVVKDVLLNLRQFNAECKFKRGVLNLMSNCLNEDEIANLKNLFNRIDENGDGKITVGELSKALEKAGTNITKNDVANLLKMADIDGDGTLSYNELVATSVQRKLSAKEERLWLAFCAVDLDRNGKVSAQEIEKVLGTDFASAKQMIAEVDRNGDGQIDFDEFITMWVHDDQNSTAAFSPFDAALAAAAASPKK